MKKSITIFTLLMMAFVLVACQETTEVDESPKVISYEWTESLDLQAVEYEDREFFRDGIGEVTLERCVDGDTTFFQSGTSRPFSVRYIGIDTRESTSRVDAWGMPASLYLCEILESAETIVLERDSAVGNKDNFGRELAYVWIDGVLINLRMVEEAFTPAVGAGVLKYGDAFLRAQQHAMSTGRRIWGETDPSFDGEPVDVTVEEFFQNKEQYAYKFLNITGYVTEVSGGDFRFGTMEGEDILVYARNQIPATIADAFQPGSQIRLNNIFLTNFNDQWQLTNFIIRDVEFLD
jgi:endonuclease YncB( thermonuclease family)